VEHPGATDRAYWLAWSLINGVGPVLRKRIHQALGSLETAWQAPIEALQQIDGIGPKLSQAIVDQRRSLDPAAQLATYSQQNPHFLTPADPAYPRRLWTIPDPPALLHYQGNLQLLEASDAGSAVAIVGTRQLTAYGQRWTERLSQALSRQGWTIVSGLAAGIDTVAHRSCLETQGWTIGVLGTGLDIIYPAANAGLHYQIAQEGLLLSEYPAGTPADRAHFPARNRIVAALSQATIVTEAGRESGALITAHLAQKYGQTVHVLAGSLDNPEATGCLALIREGMTVITSETDLYQALGPLTEKRTLSHERPDRPAPQPQSTQSSGATVAQPPTIDPPRLAPDLRPELHRLWQTLHQSSGPIALDDLVEQMGQPTGELLAALLELELHGLIEAQADLRYQAIGP
jgi:DNA processing protein